jgi:hypothetical protein
MRSPTRRPLVEGARSTPKTVWCMSICTTRAWWTRWTSAPAGAARQRFRREATSACVGQSSSSPIDYSISLNTWRSRHRGQTGSSASTQCAYLCAGRAKWSAQMELAAARRQRDRTRVAQHDCRWRALPCKYPHPVCAAVNQRDRWIYHSGPNEPPSPPCQGRAATDTYPPVDRKMEVSEDREPDALIASHNLACGVSIPVHCYSLSFAPSS